MCMWRALDNNFIFFRFLHAVGKGARHTAKKNKKKKKNKMINDQLSVCGGGEAMSVDCNNL